MPRFHYEEAVRRGWIKREDVPQGALKGKAQKADAEGEEQAILIERFREDYPDLKDLLIHIPNGGSRKNAFEGWRLKRQGVRAGVSDLFLPVARGGFIGLWIEFKATPPFDAAIAPSQEEWIQLMRQQGYRAEVCLGIDAALEVIAGYVNRPPTLDRHRHG